MKTAKNGNFCEKLLTENYFETVLATFCCYDLGDISLQIKKSVPNAPRLLASAKKGCFLEHLRRKLKKLLKFLGKKSNNWPMMSFIQNGSEIITWMGYNFKTKSKSTKSQATFLRKA